MSELNNGTTTNDTTSGVSNAVNNVRSAAGTSTNAYRAGKRFAKNHPELIKKGKVLAKKAGKTAGKAGGAAIKAFLANPFTIPMIFFISSILLVSTMFTSLFCGGGSKDDEITDIYDICINDGEIPKEYEGVDWLVSCKDEIAAMRKNAVFYSGETQDDIENGGYAWDVTDPLFNVTPEADGEALLIVAESETEYGTIETIDIYPSRGNDEEGYSPGVIVVSNENDDIKAFRMMSYAENGVAYEYPWGESLAKSKTKTWETVSGDVNTPLSIGITDDLFITSLPYLEQRRNTLAPGSYQDFIDGKLSDSMCFKVALGDLIWLYKHTEVDETNIIIHEESYEGEAPKARISKDSAAHFKEALACAVLMESWFVDTKPILNSKDVNSVDWLGYGKCFTGKDYMAANYDYTKDGTWNNLERFLGKSFKKEKILDIIEIAKQIDGYVTEQTGNTNVEQLFDGERKYLVYTSDECQALWDEIFKDHANNPDSLSKGNWDRYPTTPSDVGSGPQCTDFASWRCWKQYGHGTAGGNGWEVARKLVAAYPDEFYYSITPKAGAIFSWGTGEANSAGHVGFVEKVDGDDIYISDGNIFLGNMYHGIRINECYKLSTLKALYPSINFANPRSK